MARNVKVTQSSSTQPAVSAAELQVWRERIAAWEDEVVADAKVLGQIPIIDYMDRPFEVPLEIDLALRLRRDPYWREARVRDARKARREAEHRLALAGMLREKGNPDGAALQEEAAAQFDRLAAAAEAEAES